MNHPEFWGWSTGPLTIHFWGWENASDLKGAAAPRVVHAGQLPCVALDETRSCVVAAAVSRTPKSVCVSYPGVTVNETHVPGICCAQSAQLVACSRSIPKVQDNACVEKVVKGKTLILSPISERPAVVSDVDQRHIIPKTSI